MKLGAGALLSISFLLSGVVSVSAAPIDNTPPEVIEPIVYDTEHNEPGPIGYDNELGLIGDDSEDHLSKRNPLLKGLRWVATIGAPVYLSQNVRDFTREVGVEVAKSLIVDAALQAKTDIGSKLKSEIEKLKS